VTRLDLVGTNSSSYGPTSPQEKRTKRLRYRINPPTRESFNLFQRSIWRIQRLILGDNGRIR